MLADVVDLLACPVCRGSCRLDAASVRCSRGHVFDVARQGYVNLLAGGADTGTADTPGMVAARAAFLDAGHFAPLTRRLVEVAVAAAREGVGRGNDVDAEVGTTPRAARADGGGGVGSAVRRRGLVDLGAGTGHHLAAVLDALPERAGLALDLSKHAMRRAARAHGRIGAAVCDAWGALPVRDGSVDVALNVFAPRNVAELARVLVPGGSVVVVTPLAEHLAPLVDRLALLTVDADKALRVDRQLAAGFSLVDAVEHRHAMRLRHDDVRAVVGMGPSAWHVDPPALDARIATLPAPVEVTSAVRIARYRRAGS